MKSYLVIGGGTAGCVIASRLSEDPDNQVTLLEAGPDYSADDVPEDIAASYSGRVLYNKRFFWPDLHAAPNDRLPPVKYEQARVLGGGSSINGQVALRGSPADYDRWAELGATGWGWDSVLPYFCRAETDLDFGGNAHGKDGPIRIRRIPPEQWDGFTKAAVSAFAAEGYQRREDMNADYGEGFAPVSLANDGVQRSSCVTAYLSAAVRARKNLTIHADTQVERLLVEGRRVTGAIATQNGQSRGFAADHVVLSAGAVHSPFLLMKSGIGPAEQLAQRGIEPLIDLPGVGQNLQDHPTISAVAFTAPQVRRKVLRHNFVNLVYSSGLEGTPPGDMILSVICKTAWHALGDRMAALSTYIGKPYSAGEVTLGSPEASSPKVVFNWLSDERDLRRAADAFRMNVGLLRRPEMSEAVLNIFATGFSPRVKKIGQLTEFNRLLTQFTGRAMDASSLIRNQIIQRAASDGSTVDELLESEALLTDYLRRTATGIWHPSGTCRMGPKGDPMAVTDAKGQVFGLDNLTVADASIMPEIPMTNLNLPVTMIGERIADILQGRAG